MPPLTAHHIVLYSCPLSLSLLLFLSISGCPRSTASHLYTKCAIVYEDVTFFGPVCMQERGYAPISSWVALVVPTSLLDRVLHTSQKQPDHHTLEDYIVKRTFKIWLHHDFPRF